MADEEHHESEAELAMKKRQAKKSTGGGLDEADKELLETNRQERKRMEEEINELRQRNEKRKKEREIEEKRLTAERNAEDARRKAEEEERKKKKEEEDAKKHQARAMKMADVERMKNPPKPNFVISKKGDSGEQVAEGGAEGGSKKSKEQLDAEKRAILKQRIEPLNIAGFDASKLTEKAKELHKQLTRLEGEKYDLERRFKNQQIEMQDLAQRARQANKTSSSGTLKRVEVSEDCADKIQLRFAGTPSKIEMYSKYERQKDQRNYTDRKTLYVGPQYVLPAERIKPSKIVKWNAEGLPIYEEVAGGAGGEGHA